MKPLILALFTLVLTCFSSYSQKTQNYQIDFTQPESVVEAIFYAAKTKDFSVMQCLCDPFGEGDGDTKMLCSVSDIPAKIDNNEATEKDKKLLSEFITMFKSGEVNGAAAYHKHDGVQYAQVPILFGLSGKKIKGEETVKLVNRFGNWYLSSI